MRFLSAEAYEVLQKLSADERKRLEYEARLNVLNEHLIKDNRLDDLKKAIVDETYREKLYEEYKLSL